MRSLQCGPNVLSGYFFVDVNVFLNKTLPRRTPGFIPQPLPSVSGRPHSIFAAYLDFSKRGPRLPPIVAGISTIYIQWTHSLPKIWKSFHLFSLWKSHLRFPQWNVFFLTENTTTLPCKLWSFRLYHTRHYRVEHQLINHCIDPYRFLAVKLPNGVT